MKAYEFISRLDEARYGRRMSEDGCTAPVAPAPSHAPTSGSDATTKGQGKSEDKGETVKKAYKQPTGSIPAPVAPAPSHAPTSGTDATTKGQGKSEDKGEAIKKDAMKEALRQLIDGDVTGINDLLSEGGHKPGCTCGFCKNKGKFGKKKDAECDDDKGSDCDKGGPKVQEAEGEAGMPISRRLGGGRMSFRHGIDTNLKNSRRYHGWHNGPSQNPKFSQHYNDKGLPKQVLPSQDLQDLQHPRESVTGRKMNLKASVQEMADDLLEAPGND